MDFLKLQMTYVDGHEVGVVHSKETWLWNYKVDNAVKEKPKVWKQWDNGVT